MPTFAMNLPVWDMNGLSGGLVIATIAVIHVFVAQFAVGGGFFLLLAEYRGHREKSAPILRWVHRHTRFFLLLTLVFGSLTGVGIWLVISMVAPGGTSLLIREFVYAWAAEWVFFLAEILALFLYAASFARAREGRMPARDHMLLGAAYAGFAFLSLFVINGIISFMLTPGAWLQNGDFWSAFFNPGFWPSLLFRSGLSFVLAGMFGLITATAIPDEETRGNMVSFCAQWICLPFALMLIGIVWYVSALPEEVRLGMQRRTDDIRPFVRSFLDTAPVLFLAGMFLFIRFPRKAYLPYVAVVLSLGLIVAGSFEWIRETARRPWLVYGHMYSNGITAYDGGLMKEKGVFALSGWSRLRAAGPEGFAVDGEGHPDGSGGKGAAELASLDPEQRARFSRFVFTQQCANCHGLGAPLLDILPRIRGRGEAGIAALLAGQGLISPYMPPFFGTDEERHMLAAWLAALHSGK